MNRLHRLHEAGQSVWYDNVRRRLLRSGDLVRYRDDYAVTGVDLNLTIFDRAVTSSGDYDEALRAADPDTTAESLFFELALDDVVATADLLRPVYAATSGIDGFVSFEMLPGLANDAEGTVAAASELFARADRPNVMVKVPGTPDGLEAVEELTAAGVNVNVTLLFSVEHYRAAAEAWMRGLERRAEAGDALTVSSVASVYVSRWDSSLDPGLRDDLRGRTGVATAHVVYAAYCELLKGERWRKLARAGARTQRVLWASTGTKDPHLPDTYYVTALAAPGTVNTVPEATLLAFADEGEVGELLTPEADEAEAALAEVADAGIDLDGVAATLQERGVKILARAFDHLLEDLDAKLSVLRGDTPATGPLSAAVPASESLGDVEAAAKEAVAELGRRDAVRRAYRRDHTLWQDDPTEVANRLGWLFVVAPMEHQVPELEQFTARCRADGLSHAVLMGMGGSSLFPEVMVETFGRTRDGLELFVLDTTDPAAIGRVADELPLDRTLFIAASKSGGTIETRSQLELFWQRVGDRPEQFAVITDPGSELGRVGNERGFRQVFENRPDIGGRYSALSHYGLMPAGVLGVDVGALLERAGHMAVATAPCVAAEDNPGLRLGAIMAAAIKAGRDKLTLVLPDEIASFGLWVEQLVAESTGKQGTGMLPVVGEPLGPPDVYGDDRLFVAIGSESASELEALADAGHPVVELPYTDRFDIGAEVMRWELGTCLAGVLLGINPFDQPDVAEAKSATARVLEHGLPEIEPEPLDRLLEQVRPGDYISIQAYVDPWGDVVGKLQDVRVRLRDRYRVATTVGVGPRFLHSTGQFHKGGPPTGVFIQVVGEDTDDLDIPGRDFGFSMLKRAQAAGDLEALHRLDLRAARVAVDDLLAFPG
ncbi:MAG TPA: bifunctional transaldolase/phosoglucose isomerase [Acidimicrobiales bacterium]|nr:bifunctional transaldolase/phosoglucose isomerase [Acidimicrobiales bacterium]